MVTAARPPVDCSDPVAISVGIDVGADRVHVVGITDTGDLAIAAVLDPVDRAAIDDLLAALPPATSVAIDGPAGPSSAPFAADPSVSTKFRNARGCEVVLGREYGIWVSFATGTEPLTGWMQVAASIHDLARRRGHVPLEVYPHAVFRLLVNGRPPKKTTAAGIEARVRMLRDQGLTEATLPLWSHDALDAAGAAVVARDHRRGIARRAYCPTDDTSVWLPAPLCGSRLPPDRVTE